MNNNHKIFRLALEKNLLVFDSLTRFQETIDTYFLDTARKTLQGNITRIVCPINIYITLDAELHLERMSTKFYYEDFTEIYVKEGYYLPSSRTKICILSSGNKHIIGAL